MNQITTKATRVSETQLIEKGNEPLHQIKIRLVNFFQPEKLICFSSQVKHVETSSCLLMDGPEVQAAELTSYGLLLIPAANENMPDILLQQKAEDICRDIASVTVLVHRMEEVNLALQNGSAFFGNIYKKGILLHDRDELIFAVPQEGGPISNRIVKREKYWAKFHQLSIYFMKGARFYANEGIYPLAIFMLHQALQHNYAGTLKVLTGYKSNSNSLGRLVRLIEMALPHTELALTKNTPEDTRLNALLLKGYSDARYQDKFEVSTEEVQTLLNRISHLIDEANGICKHHLSRLKAGKVAYKK